MEKKTKEVVEALQFLAERCNDGSEGYSDAGNAVPDANLRQWLFDKSEQRKKFALDLNAHAVKLGGESEDDTSFLGKLHREWLDFKANVVDDTSEEVLEECIRGEEKAAADYRRILVDTVMPADIKQIVKDQYNAIKAARAELEAAEELLDARD